MRDYLGRVFGFDTRSLAVFRVALGLLLLADIAWRLPRFDTWLAESGAWPIAAALSEAARSWSLYFWNASSAWAVALLTISALAAAALITGWQTRLATVVSWVFLVSLQTRNTLPLNAGDILLRLLLFWGAFLPLGGRWSIDARKSGRSGTAFSAGSTALVMQVALVYVFNALYKTGEAWKSGAAISQVLHQETYATSFGMWTTQWPGFLKAATHLTWWFELLGPALLFSPWKTGWLRGLVALGFMGFHLALLATLRIGLFPLICIAAWIPFLPGGFWDGFLRCCRRNPSMEQARPPDSAAAGSDALRICGVVAQCVAVLLIPVVIAGNVLRYFNVPRPAWFRVTSGILRLDQQWSLFAPDPSRSEGWMVVVIEGDDGKEYDALTGAEVNWTRPANLGSTLESGQWRKYLAAVRNRRYPKRPKYFADWCVAEWKRHHPEIGARRVRVHYLWEWVNKRQSPPDNWFIYEDPPGEMTELAKNLGYPVAPPAEAADL